MPTATRRGPKSATITLESIDQVRATLEELPEKPKDNLSLREAVDHLRSELSAAIEKGYSYEDLANKLAGSGIKISALTLKSYISGGKQSAGTRGRRAKSTSESSAPAKVSTEETPEPTQPKRRGRRPASESAASTAAAKRTSTRQTTAKGTPGRKRKSSS